MLWIWLILIACALLAGLLVALRRYERESATAALRRVEQLQGEVERLTRRVQHLEAIAAEEGGPASEPPPSTTPAASESSRP